MLCGCGNFNGWVKLRLAAELTIESVELSVRSVLGRRVIFAVKMFSPTTAMPETRGYI